MCQALETNSKCRRKRWGEVLCLCTLAEMPNSSYSLSSSWVFSTESPGDVWEARYTSPASSIQSNAWHIDRQTSSDDPNQHTDQSVQPGASLVGERVHRAQGSGGPTIAYWPLGTPGHSIQIVGRTPKETSLILGTVVKLQHMRNCIKQILEKGIAALPDASASRAAKQSGISLLHSTTLLPRFIRDK